MSIVTIINDIICYPLGAIMKLFYLFTSNYAVLLILFTLVIRAALFPMAVKQQKTSAENLRLQPKMKKLQDKYKKDQQKLQEEMSKLYSEEGFNPASGCLPLFIQMPILYGLYQVVYNPLKYLMWYPQSTIDKIASALRDYVIATYPIDNFNDTRTQIYLAKAMKDRPDLLGFLGTPQTIDFNLFGIDLTEIPRFGWTILILIPILVYITQAASSFLSFKMNSAIQATQPGGKMQTYLMTFLLPLMSVWLSTTLPASIGLYWIVLNLLMCGQVFILNKFYSLDRLAVIAAENAEKRKEEIRSGQRKPSRMQRMAQQALEMQNQQEAAKKAYAPKSKGKVENFEPVPVKLNSKGKKSRSQIKEEQRRRLAKARQDHQEL